MHLHFTDADEPVGLQLPNQWLWDIIDEFIYQVSVSTNKHSFFCVFLLNGDCLDVLSLLCIFEKGMLLLANDLFPIM